MYRFEDIENNYKEMIANLHKLCEQIKEAINEVIKNNEMLQQKVKLLCSIKGVGTLTATTIIAETNGFALFENIKQLISYAGYDVIENQSGDHVGKTKISKKGNSHIRRILHMPALNAVTYEVKPFTDLYQRIYLRTNIKMKGYVAVQKKLLATMYTLWKRDEMFDPDYQKTIREREPKSSFGLAS
jgi:transposase